MTGQVRDISGSGGGGRAGHHHFSTKVDFCDGYRCLTPRATKRLTGRNSPGRLQQLLMDANYVEMPREQVIAGAEYQAQTGLIAKANLSHYAQLQVFFRGIRHEPRAVRLWLTPWRRKNENANVFSRVASLCAVGKTSELAGVPETLQERGGRRPGDVPALCPHPDAVARSHENWLVGGWRRGHGLLESAYRSR